MAYATASDVQSEFKSIDFAATGAAVTTAEVTEFIVQEEALLEGRIAGIYSTPVTGARAISVMKKLTIDMVKARVQEILATKMGVAKVEQGSTAELLRSNVDKRIEEIVTRKVQLLDGTLAHSGGGVQSYTNENEATLERAFAFDDGDKW